ncbi:MAG TPA: DUF2703 domain-containing protein [Aggregatilineales bacterium]|nr:DUF2703 domain-containing protein [Aggregatilineales bacterium]
MLKLKIVWQRLLSPEGKTCDRCDATYHEIFQAVAKLKVALAPLGIEPDLEVRAIDDSKFRKAPSESNRIWVAGQPIEEWLNATVGSSPCCSVCGDSPCRTVEIGGQRFEVVPESLLLRASLVAASSLLAPQVAPASEQNV